MKTFLRLSAILLLLAAASCSRRPEEPVVITQVPIEYFNDSTAPVYLSDLKTGGVDVALVSITDIFDNSPAWDTTMTLLHDAIRFFEKAGLEVGVWTSTLGYGGERPQVEAICPGVQKLTNFDGRTSGAVCSTDKAFLELAKKNVRDFAKAGARFILLDDDLVQSVRPGFTCVCKNHLALLEEATGRPWTREEVRDLFTGAPSPERTAFLDVMGKSMTDFCKGLREAVDEVDPDIVMGICASYTHFDAEGVDMEELSRLLAGEGHTPFLRLSGATYWPIVAPRVPGGDLGDVTEFARMQIGWYRDRGIILFDENDPYPRKSDIVPASWCELYDKVMMANGGVNRHKYMCCYEPVDPDRAYVEAHVANMKDDEVLLDIFRGTAPCGFRVWNSEHVLRGIVLPDSYTSDGEMMLFSSHSAGAVFLRENCIPTCYEGTGMPGIAFGDQARLLPPEALAGGLVLDVPAALALKEKGIDVGLDAAIPVLPDSASIDGQTIPFTAPEGTCFGLVPGKDADVQVAGEFLCGEERIPSCLVSKTKDGVFAIFGWDGYRMLLPKVRSWGSALQAAQLKALYRTMSGGQAMAAPVFEDNLYAVTSLSPAGDRLSVLLCNMGKEAFADTRMEIPEGWSIARTLRTDAALEGETLRLTGIPAEEWSAVELVKD